MLNHFPSLGHSSKSCDSRMPSFKGKISLQYQWTISPIYGDIYELHGPKCDPTREEGQTDHEWDGH